MSVLLERARLGTRPRRRPAEEASPPSAETAGAGLDIGIVNNMPDSALHGTERQFAGLIEAASPGLPVRVRFFSLPAVPRSAAAEAYVRSRYADIDELNRRPPDALVVTGTEPRAPDLSDEPYWPSLAGLVRWAERNAVPTIWSCLAAHAAVLELDGVRRRPLGGKRVGVFEFQARAGHPLLAGVPAPVLTPHSRYNDLAEAELAARGYEILTASPEAGVDAFARPGAGPFLFFQGHPEYGPRSLWHEYRRDVGRFLRGEAQSYPDLPANYLPAEAEARLRAFRERAEAGRTPDLVSRLPEAGDLLGERKPWGDSAVVLYRNWLRQVAVAKTQ